MCAPHTHTGRPAQGLLRSLCTYNTYELFLFLKTSTSEANDRHGGIR